MVESKSSGFSSESEFLAHADLPTPLVMRRRG